jgi:hypothetical protein
MNTNIIKNATVKKNKKINELLKMKESMIEQNISDKIIKKYVDEQYEIINNEYTKNINKKMNPNKLMNKRKEKAVEFLIKNKLFLEQNKVKQEYIDLYVKTQYEDINKTYVIKNNILSRILCLPNVNN